MPFDAEPDSVAVTVAGIRGMYGFGTAAPVARSLLLYHAAMVPLPVSLAAGPLTFAPNVLSATTQFVPFSLWNVIDPPSRKLLVSVTLGIAPPDWVKKAAVV